MTDYDHGCAVAATFHPDSLEYQVALFHDHIEDGLGPFPSGSRRFGKTAILQSVEVLTRREGESYEDYIQRVKQSGDLVSIRVKIADAKHNLERCRGLHGGIEDPKRARRYEYVLSELGGLA